VCGIAGLARGTPRGIDPDELLRMAATLRHRGPDGFGLYVGDGVGFAHTRLSIIDLHGGAQPLTNEDGRVIVVFNGEIFNYLDLRDTLQDLGHRFRTQSDTEVLAHGYEEWGEGLLPRLNGEFAFAVFDRRRRQVLLARDRFGIRPLYFATPGSDLIFGSEAKAIFATGEIRAEPDYAGIDEVFTCWAARPPRTVFRGISALEPGTYALWKDGRLRTARYYEFSFRDGGTEPPDAVEQLDELLRDSVRLRLQADVPVGGYLSGGLDSSCTCALATEASPYAVRTFSVTFDDPALNEAAYQQLVARRIHSEHAVQAIGSGDIGRVFPDVVWHAETPLVRTGPAPLYLLSRLTQERGIKVVLSGEGADELFLGYDLFKETVVRLFCLRQPESRWRPLLFDRLYPYLAQRQRGGEFWRKFFLQAGVPDDPLFSHLPRFQLTGRIKGFYSPEMREAVRDADALDSLRSSLPADFSRWPALHRAAYLEMVTLLSPYLLSSQGDRMALAHGVEGRVPFLDHRLFEFVASLPPDSKLRGLREKHLLRRWASRHVPQEVLDRPKQPYRAPDVPAFFGEHEAPYVAELLDAAAIERAGLFNPEAVARLVHRCRAGRATGFRENQALVGILSTQLWFEAFVLGRREDPVLRLEDADVVLTGAAAVSS